MSKFLTPPVWYDGDGNLVEILAKAKSHEGTKGTLPGAGVGVNANAGNGSTAIGTNASAPNFSVAIGCDAKDSTSGGVAVGAESMASGGYSVSVGLGATASGGHSVAIGGAFIDQNDNSETPTTAAGSAVAIGCGASATAFGCIAIGAGTTSKKSNSSVQNQPGAIVIGQNSSVTGSNSIAIGKNSSVNGDGSIAIGSGITLGTDESRIDPTIQIGGPKLSYTFKVGNIDVFDAINTAAKTFYINTSSYTATYDPASGTLNFITSTT